MHHDESLDFSYVCPRTRSPLRLEGMSLKGDAAASVYALRNGIPQFLCFGATEGPETSARLQQLNAAAANEGWLAALTTVYASDPAMVRYVTEANRATFLDLLPIDRQSDVLEIGPGLGQFTAAMARRAASVSALEVVAGQAEFVARRCREEGLHNVRVAVGGDDCRLPYADASFDVIVLNLVFEWCASRCVDEDPLQVQHRLLTEMARVLKPGGTLYLATKNRFALKYLIGKRDEHVHGMRFGNALPRWLVGLLLRLRGLPRAPGLLHSHPTLAGMLRHAGFDRVASFWATPEMRYPKEYVPTDADAIRSARKRDDFVQGEGRVGRLLMRRIPAPWVKYFTPGLAFLATKGHRGQ
jgi:SAM-dependent methyltransferase